MAPRPTLRQERAAWAEERLLVGVDEAGRGPLAGPVVAAAVVFPAGCAAVRGLRDSKTLPAPIRLKLAVRIRQRALAFGVGAASLARDRSAQHPGRHRAGHAPCHRRPAPAHAASPAPPHPHRRPAAARDRLRPRRADRRRCALPVHLGGRHPGQDRARPSHAPAGPRYPVYSWETNVGYATAGAQRGARGWGRPAPPLDLCSGGAIELEALSRSLRPPRTRQGATTTPWGLPEPLRSGRAFCGPVPSLRQRPRANPDRFHTTNTPPPTTTTSIHQRIEVSGFSWDSPSFDGRVTTTVVARAPGLAAIVLDLDGRLDGPGGDRRPRTALRFDRAERLPSSSTCPPRRVGRHAPVRGGLPRPHLPRAGASISSTRSRACCWGRAGL